VGIVTNPVSQAPINPLLAPFALTPHFSRRMAPEQSHQSGNGLGEVAACMPRTTHPPPTGGWVAGSPFGGGLLGGRVAGDGGYCGQEGAYPHPHSLGTGEEGADQVEGPRGRGGGQRIVTPQHAARGSPTLSSPQPPPTPHPSVTCLTAPIASLPEGGARACGRVPLPLPVFHCLPLPRCLCRRPEVLSWRIPRPGSLGIPFDWKMEPATVLCPKAWLMHSPNLLIFCHICTSHI